MNSDKGRRLGRGLEALLTKTPTRLDPQSATASSAGAATGTSAKSTSPLRAIALSKIVPNPLQPRKEFRPEDLADLEASLKTSGLLQPITVRQATRGDGFELIAGERRFRAAQRLGWAEIQAIVKDVDDQQLLSLAMVENLQRADLNPIEEAEGYQQLITDFSLTQQEVADIVGKDRSTVANTLRLLALPASVRRLVWDGQLTVGHARALLGIGNEMRIADLAKDVVSQGLSVREVERRVREMAKPATGERHSADRTQPDVRSAEVRRLEDQLRKRLGTDARIVQSGRDKGELRIPFYGTEDFERVLELVLGSGVGD
jgi:ParB family transcriptional regulator, chromosome partitioning protein